MTSVVFQSCFQVESFNVPYISFISGGLQAGKAFFIQGTIPPQSNSFAVKLKCGQSESDDIAFQIKPDFSTKCLVVSSRKSNLWGQEEKLALPLQKGSSFDLIIVVNAENYQVFLNRGEVGRFRHRLPLETVTYLDIGGQVSLSNVVFIESWAGCSMFEAGGMMFQGGSVTFNQGQSEITGGLGSTTQKLIQLKLSPGQPEVSILNPVQNPKLPYTGPMLGGLKAGMALYFQGTVASNADRFGINFKTGQSDKDDIAFHFNPRLSGPVVMNCFRNGKWETEEYISNNPFKTGEAFQMFIVTRPEGYELYINGKPNYIFKHRIPLDKVTALNIFGDVNMNICGFIENCSTLSLPPFTTTTSTGIVVPPNRHPEFILQIQCPTLPYVGPISGGLKPGMAFYLKGVAGTRTDWFAINFKTGQSDKDDVAFQFNPRYNGRVVMRSFRNGAWEVEEYGPANPFKMGAAFEIIFVFKSEEYQVYVNGSEHYLFKHRIPLDKVSTLNIAGDVGVNLGGFIQTWSTSSFAKTIQKPTIQKPTIQKPTVSPAVSHWSPSSILSELTQNPAVPYSSTIPGGLRPGMALYLQGFVGTSIKQFTVNFRTGEPGKSEVAFHLNPRFKSRVVMNTWRYSAWESTSENFHENPFKQGEPFEMFIVIRSDGYQIYVNSKEHHLYKHRIAMQYVVTLEIREDVLLKYLGYIQNWNSLGFLRWGFSTIQSELSNAVRNPALPYVSLISEGLKAGLAFYFQGIAGTTGDQFTISLKTGQADNDDVAFHFNPQYNAEVVMNSFRYGGWEVEEYGPDNPFKMGEIFEMFIVIKPEVYQVYVNGREYYLFKHRIPLENVTALNICGNVVVNLFAHVNRWITSTFVKQLGGFFRWSSIIPLSELSQPLQNPCLPYMGLISGGLRAGMAFYLQGVIGTKGDQFEINFKTGQSTSHEIAFCYNPRYYEKVVMNTWRNAAWEAISESSPQNPYRTGEAFDLVIVFTSEGYQVYVNGYDPTLYKHRIPLQNVSTLTINGDVIVKLCGFIQNWSKCSAAIEHLKSLNPGISHF